MKKTLSSFLAVVVLSLMFAAPASAAPGQPVPYWGRVNGTLFGSLINGFSGSLSVVDSQGGYQQYARTTSISVNYLGMMSAQGLATTYLPGGTIYLNFSLTQTGWNGTARVYTGSWTITGGTGKFAGAQGSGTLSGEAITNSVFYPTEITIDHNFTGTITLKDTI